MWRFSACRCLCRDEFLVLRLIAASQQRDEELKNSPRRIFWDAVMSRRF